MKRNVGSDEVKDYSRTAAAIEAYDAHDATYTDTDGLCQEDVLKWFAKSEELGKEVGRAFGLDTADRNSLETCIATIRPGHARPGPGFELSFVRKAIIRWKERQS